MTRGRRKIYSIRIRGIKSSEGGKKCQGCEFRKSQGRKASPLTKPRRHIYHHMSKLKEIFPVA